MKSTKYILSLAVIATLALGSCKKELDQPLLGSFEPGSYFTSDANANLAVNAAYFPLAFTSATSNAVWVLGDVASDDAVTGGPLGESADYERVGDYNIIPSNAAVEAVWQRYYDGVFKSNVVLDGLAEANTSVSENVRKLGIAQAKFLRAYYYFILTNYYGKIPLRIKVESPAELQSPAREQADIYAQIEKDLTEAAVDLPPSWTGNDVGRATKGAALALLAKAYLFESKWEPAAEAAGTVAASYTLTQKFADNFSQSAKNNTEVIFSAWHLSGSSPFLGNNLNQWFAPRSLNGYGYFWPTQKLVDNFEKTGAGIDDPRLDYTVGRAGHSYFETPFNSSWSGTGFVSKKHTQPLSEIPANIKGDGNLNYEAIRLGDILLVQAEALNEAGRSGEALIPLNKIRKRARESYLYDATLPGSGTVPAGLLPDITTTNQSELRDIIRRERRSELALEFQRFFDVMRYGSNYATGALNDKPNFNYNNNRFFPIPQSERDANKAL
jgi:starch-binding outer membrane protein, SusD/RagB family